MSVLILGATSRLGHAIALQYAGLGQTVFLGARDSAERARVAGDVRLRGHARVEHALFDARDDHASHVAFVDVAEAALGPISVAVLAFGDMGEQTQAESDFEAARRVLEVNYTGAVSVCEALAARMKPRQAGAIVGIASVAGDRGRKSNYFYGSAKGAFALYLQGLRGRLYADSVTVTTVKLGFVDTRMTWGLESGIPKASPESAARAIVRAQRAGKDTIYYPSFWRPIMGIIKAVPEALFKKTNI